jgi:6-phosphogluconate dehydrogenase
MKADIGMIGLGVMGSSLARNCASKDFTVACYDYSAELRSEFSRKHAGERLLLSEDLEALIGSLERPRKIMLMIKAGAPVDSVLKDLLPLLEAGDVVIDGGNSQASDTGRRVEQAAEWGVAYVGCGVSGGESGALTGPSLMPGGAAEAWPLIRPLFEAICAKSRQGFPCCAWIGDGGAGHFVKTVHNGIEYADMQLICEAYHIMRDVLCMNNAEMADVFGDWNKGPLESFLIEITADILRYQDTEGHQPIDYILDVDPQLGQLDGGRQIEAPRDPSIGLASGGRPRFRYGPLFSMAKGAGWTREIPRRGGGPRERQ